MRLWHYSLALLLLSPLAGIYFARLHRPSVDDYIRRARTARTVGRITEAETALRHVVARNSRHSVARLHLAELGLARDDSAMVIAALRGIPELDPLSVGARLTEGDAWYQLNHLAAAEGCWDRARQLAPEHPSVRFWLMHLYAIQLRWTLWREILWEVYDRKQAGLEEMVQLMVAGMELRNFSTDIGKFRLAVAADPDDVHTCRALGLHLLRGGQLLEARRELTSLRDRHPDDAETWLAVAECLVACGDAAALGRLLAQPPTALHKNPHFWQAQGSLALLEGRPRDAVEHYRRALDVAPYLKELHVKMAEALRLAGDHEGSRPHLETIREMARIEQTGPPLHTNGWDLDPVCQLVRCCERLLLIEEALGWVQVGLANAPDNPFLLQARDRLAAKPATSSRNPPTWESLKQSVCW